MFDNCIPWQPTPVHTNQIGKIQYFSSACINTALLYYPDTTLFKYPSLRGKSKAGALAVKLAHCCSVTRPFLSAKGVAYKTRLKVDEMLYCIALGHVLAIMNLHYVLKQSQIDCHVDEVVSKGMKLFDK